MGIWYILWNLLEPLPWMVLRAVVDGQYVSSMPAHSGAEKPITPVGAVTITTYKFLALHKNRITYNISNPTVSHGDLFGSSPSDEIENDDDFTVLGSEQLRRITSFRKIFSGRMYKIKVISYEFFSWSRGKIQRQCRQKST